MKNPDFELRFKVRDYECDFQGIVNNANYLHYLEHTRHEFTLLKDISVTELHNRGIDTVLARIDVQYKSPLRSRDEFISQLRVEVDGYRITFYQEIIKVSDGKLCCRAKVDTVCVVNGKLDNCKELTDKIMTK